MAPRIISPESHQSSHAITRVHIIDCQGDLVVQASDQNAVAIDDTQATPETQQHGETLIVRPAPGNLNLHIPTAAAVVVENMRGTLNVNGVGALSVNTADSDVRIESIEGLVLLHDLDGNLDVRDAGSLTLTDGPRRRNAAGRERGVYDAHIHRVGTVEIEHIRHDLELREAQIARIENIGGNCTVDDVSGDIQLANVGGSCTIERVGGKLKLENVGGSLTMNTIGSVETLGNVGGSLTMNAATLNAFSPTHDTHIAVGGSAQIALPAEANVTILATVGGSIRAQDRGARGPGMHRLVYGDGAAHLHIIAGGNIELSGSVPQQTGSAWSEWTGIGAEIGRAVGNAFGLLGRGEGQPAERPSPSSQPSQPFHPSTGSTVRMDDTMQGNKADRESVLRMVAAGQVSPEDGEAMLEALGA